MVGAELTPVAAPTGVLSLLWLIPALPLAGAAVNLFFGKRLGRAAGVLGSLTVVAAFVVSALAVRDLLGLPSEGRLVVQHLFDWISVGRFTVGADLRLDAESATMIMVVTGVGALIHIYSIGYMRGDARYGRFFSYMNLFVFFMLMLVLGQNFLVLYLGWEGVGLCSYLLIGFWFEKKENAEAAKKAFITTRIGDAGMMVGIALIAFKFGTLDFDKVFSSAPGVLTAGAATAISLLLFSGAVGKSAQVPLHVWLPDAMAGPTPVSALIHAATMVTAGVYLVVRTHVLFALSPIALDVVAITGLITMLFAGTVALGQWDIKRVLAWSTISQLGYMFMAAGLGAYSIAMFFLVAHAFYKALLFLGSGSVIHGMHDEQDMRKMGGLSSRMPVTAITMSVAALSLAGFPFLAGFYAKDLLLEVAETNARWGFYVLGSVGALFSALYIFRLVFLTFFREARSEEAAHAHESPAVMTVPLAILAAGAVLAGLLSLSPEGWIHRFLEAVLGAAPVGSQGLSKPVFYAIAMAITFGGLGLAWWVWGSGRVDWMRLRERLEPLPTTLLRGWYVDRAYDLVLIQPAKALAGIVAFVVDARWIDGLVNAIGGGVKRLAQGGRLVQTGYVRTYALAVFLGAVVVLAYVGVRL
ncbi:MAG: NADH-quinone oxidoreductase subunit L [Planctomycetaceae bacterium]